MPNPTTAIKARKARTGMRRATGAPRNPPRMVPIDMARHSHQTIWPPTAKITALITASAKDSQLYSPFIACRSVIPHSENIASSTIPSPPLK